MAKIQLVVEIDEELYEFSNNPICVSERTKYEQRSILLKAISNGIPLPKGHGELKDADAMINKLCTQEASELFGSITCAEIMDFISDEKPIIEADKEG